MKLYLSISSVTLGAYYRYLELNNIPPEDVFQRAGINTALLSNPEQRFSLEAYDRLIHHCLLAVQDPDLGLHAGECLFPDKNNIIGLIVMNCQTLGMVLEKYRKFQRILGEGIRVQIRREWPLIHLSFHLLDDNITYKRHMIECMVSEAMMLMGRLSIYHTTPLDVVFQHRQPTDITEHKRLFNALPKFSQQGNLLTFKEEVYDYPVVEPGREQEQVYEGYARGVLDQMEIEDPFVQRLSRYIIRNLNGDVPQLDEAAEELDMSVRNVQLLLKQKGTSFRWLLNRIREEMAVCHLRTIHASSAEISYLLGFSDVSVFKRTFKRWTGMTPAQYRVNLFDRNSGRV